MISKIDWVLVRHGLWTLLWCALLPILIGGFLFFLAWLTEWILSWPWPVLRWDAQVEQLCTPSSVG